MPSVYRFLENLTLEVLYESSKNVHDRIGSFGNGS